MESVNKKKISADIAQLIQELNTKIVIAKKLGLTVEIERFSTSENRIIKLNPEENIICFQVYEHITY